MTSSKEKKPSKKGRVRPNVPRAGIKNNGSRYCGGGRKKACGGKKS